MLTESPLAVKLKERHDDFKDDLVALLDKYDVCVFMQMPSGMIAEMLEQYINEQLDVSPDHA